MREMLSSEEIPGTFFKLNCTPARYFADRGLRDHGKTLCSSWAVEGEGKKVYFSGNTGYRYVKDREERPERPVCPALNEIERVLIFR